MIRAPRPKLWHLSALVVIAAVALALVREVSSDEAFARFFLSCVLMVAIACPILAGARLSGRVAARLYERGRARGDLAGWVLAVLGRLAYLVMGVGVAGIGSLVVWMVLMLFRSFQGWLQA